MVRDSRIGLVKKDDLLFSVIHIVIIAKKLQGVGYIHRLAS